MLMWFLGGLALLAVLVAPLVYMSSVMAWSDQKTNGLGYYGLSPTERDAFKKSLARHARILHPFVAVLGKLSPLKMASATFVQDGLAGPKGTCTPESFAAGRAYRPGSADVFVATQMKCGTTWMQHVVYEVLHRGSGTLVESGTALYAVSPWLEAVKSVSVEEAPLLGAERPTRIIKTHLPRGACPQSPEARYIYVARHPVSCFASCVDFIATNAGPMAPPVEEVEGWFTSDDAMWWGTWPAHLTGWWAASRTQENVLFVHFEEMKRDLSGVIRSVTEFLGLDPLSPEELAAVEHKCGFEYMQAHKGTFEMHPPHLLATDAQLFVRGTADRHRDVSEDVRTRILRWCAGEMADVAHAAGYPIAETYPDVAAATSPE